MWVTGSAELPFPISSKSEKHKISESQHYYSVKIFKGKG